MCVDPASPEACARQAGRTRRDAGTAMLFGYELAQARAAQLRREADEERRIIRLRTGRREPRVALAALAAIAFGWVRRRPVPEPAGR